MKCVILNDNVFVILRSPQATEGSLGFFGH